MPRRRTAPSEKRLMSSTTGPRAAYFIARSKKGVPGCSVLMQTERAAARRRSGSDDGESTKNSCGATTRFSMGPSAPSGRSSITSSPGRPSQHQRLHQVLGNLSHEDVAAPAHEHSAHRPSQYQWSLASTTISPRFSIITPVYDPPLGAFLACIDSVRSQTFADWEWCVVDDCSTLPEVRAALAKLERQDHRIRVVHRSANGGIVAASNDALSMARGEFVDAAGPRRSTAAHRAGADGGDHRLHRRRRLRVQRRGPRARRRPRVGSFQQARLVPRTIPLVDVHLPSVGAAPRRGHRGRRVPRRLRRVAGPRPHPACHGADRGTRPAGGPPSAAAVSLAQHLHVGVAGKLDADHRCRPRPSSRAGAVRSAGSRRHTWCTARVEGTYRLLRNVPPDTPVTVVMPTRAEGGDSRPYRLAAAATIEALRTTHPQHSIGRRLSGLAAGEPRRSARRRLRRALGAAAGARRLVDQGGARPGVQRLSVRGAGLGGARSGAAVAT